MPARSRFRDRFAFISEPSCPSFVVASREVEERVGGNGEGTINSHEELDAGNGSAAETVGPPPRHRLGRRHRRRGRRGRCRRWCEAHVHVAESPDRSFLSRSKNNL